jgi:Uma2 family endonuclease
VGPLTKADRISLADFEEMLADRPEDETWELIDGRVYKMMVGAVWEHSYIISNIDLAVSNHLRGKQLACRTFRESSYLKNAFDQLAALPDMMVRCGPLKPGQTSIEDPLILFEVVSPGSQSRDRLVKRMAYQQLPSLQHYILVERDRILIDHYIRRADGWHGEPPLDTLEAKFALAAIEFEMAVADIYRDVIAA